MITELVHQRLVRWYFAAWLLAWAYRLHAHVWLHQMEAPVLHNAYVDLVYWAAHATRLPELASGYSALAWTIDIILFIVPVLALIWPSKRLWIWLFYPAFILYYLCFNTFGLSHTHCLIGFLMVPIAFIPTDGRGRYLVWEGLRYFLCWAFFAAFCWKLMRGYFWAPEHGLALLQSTRAMYLAFHADTSLGQVLTWLLQQPKLVYIFMCTGALMQAAFGIGFFTKRFDKWLIVIHFCFHISTYILMDIVFFELWVLNLTLERFNASTLER